MAMNLKIAWRNIWRNPRRSLLTMTAIAFAAALLIVMLSWQFGSYAAMINSSVRLRTGHIQVQAAGYMKDREIRQVVADPAAVLAVMKNTPGITAFTCRANAFSLVASSDRTYGAMITGINPAKEARVSTIRDLIRQGRYLSPSDADVAIIGSRLAKNLKIKTGSSLTLLGQGRDGSVAASVVRVAGIFSTGIDALDRHTIYIPLNAFERIYSMNGAVHEVVAMCDSLYDVSTANAYLTKHLAAASRGLSVLDWEELMPGLVEAIKMDFVSGLIFWIILVLVVAFSILNTFLMAIFERTREFGVMMALGTTPARLMRLLFFESALMTAMGVLLGMGVGSIVTLVLQHVGIDISGASEILAHFGISGRIYPQLSVPSALIGPGIVLVITLVIALYPAIRIRRLTPVKALAHV